MKFDLIISTGFSKFYNMFLNNYCSGRNLAEISFSYCKIQTFYISECRLIQFNPLLAIKECDLELYGDFCQNRIIVKYIQVEVLCGTCENCKTQGSCYIFSLNCPVSSVGRVLAFHHCIVGSIPDVYIIAKSDRVNLSGSLIHTWVSCTKTDHIFPNNKVYRHCTGAICVQCVDSSCKYNFYRCIPEHILKSKNRRQKKTYSVYKESYRTKSHLPFFICFVKISVMGAPVL